jgi:putative PIN family toxin of toxin-antitoxin system
VKVVIDTNVFVAYLLSARGSVVWLIALWRDERFDIIVSNNLLSELTEVLERSHIKERINLQRRIALLQRLRHNAFWTPGKLETSGATSDIDDDMLVSAALEADAEFIVTWDKALLAQRNYESVTFITPDQFISVVTRT